MLLHAAVRKLGHPRAQLLQGPGGSQQAQQEGRGKDTRAAPALTRQKAVTRGSRAAAMPCSSREVQSCKSREPAGTAAPPGTARPRPPCPGWHFRPSSISYHCPQTVCSGTLEATQGFRAGDRLQQQLSPHCRPHLQTRISPAVNAGKKRIPRGRLGSPLPAPTLMAGSPAGGGQPSPAGSSSSCGQRSQTADGPGRPGSVAHAGAAPG